MLNWSRKNPSSGPDGLARYFLIKKLQMPYLAICSPKSVTYLLNRLRYRTYNVPIDVYVWIT